MEVSEMGLIDFLLFLFYYILPIAVPLAILYKLGLRITSGFIIFAIILSFVIVFYVDVIMPIHSAFSIKTLVSAIVQRYNLSSLPPEQGMMILRFIILLIHTLATSVVLIPIGIVLKFTRGE